MERFHLAGVQNSFHSVEPMNWRFIGWMRHLPVASWEVEGLDRFKYSLPPGNSQDGITIHAQALPAIGTFHAQGSRPSPDFGLDLSDIGEQYQNDMLNNSFIGVTIVPVDTPEPFVPLDFLDTISNYTTQARTVGWIKDQPTASVYLGRFNAAKACLQQNNIASTRATLQQVLQDVNVDSTSNLTSEAYALIRYNTEYLLEHLPVLPPPDTKK